MKEIIEQARKLFDAVGVVRNKGKTFLVLGLVSRDDRDIDLFTSDGKNWQFLGWRRHILPKAEEVKKYIRGAGFRVRQRRSPKLKIKPLAIKAGLGSWGMNSLVIHPQFGPWLRFVVLEIDAPLVSRGDSDFPQDPKLLPQFSGCQDCQVCLNACPVEGLLSPYEVRNKKLCKAYIELKQPTFEASRCDDCLVPCSLVL